MANKIILKKSSVASKVPLATDLEIGELAVNLADAKLYSKNASGTVIAVGGSGGSGDVVGPASATDNALARYDGTTGKLIQNGVVTQDDNGTLANVNAISLINSPTSAPTTTGSIFWDSGNQTPTVILNANTDLQLGQENIALVYNGTGSTIAKGSVVAVSGAQGQRPSVVLADADSEPLSASTLGIATEAIANGAEGFVCTFGLVRGINTSAFTAGNPIYLSQTAGAFTATRPSAPAHTVALGYVISVNASSGEVFVNINNGWELDELHNVLITSATSGNTLIYDAVAGVWKNANITGGTGLSVTNGAGTIALANTGVTSAVAGTGISVSGATGAVTVTNSDRGSSQNIFKNIAVSGQSTVVADNNDDTLTLVNGTGVSITTNATTDTITVTNTAPDQTVVLTGGTGITTSGTYPNFTVTNSGVTSFSAGTTGLTPSTGTTGAVTLAGTLALANGGTGSTTAAGARTNLGATTLGSNIFTVTNPSAITFPRFNADNTISTLSATDFRTAIGAGTGSGTVTGVTATSPVASSGGTAPVISLSSGYGDTLNPYASKTANQVLAAPNGSNGVPTFRSLVAADIPDLTLEKLPDAWVKRSVRCATTANITLSATQTIDGIAVVAGDRVLVKNQSTASQNGIYVVAAGSWTRSADANTASELAGAEVAVDSGTVNGGLTFDTDFKSTDTLDTTAISWFRCVDTNYFTTVGNNLATLSNPSAVTFPRFNADNTVSALARQDAMDALAGSTTSGQYLRGNGSDVVMSAIQAADVPTLNQNTTGSAATLTTGRTIAITGDLTYTSPSFNGSANVTAAGTLATVNANVGTFGSSSAVPVVTVNAKGLVTGVTTATVSGGQYFGSATTKAIAYNANTIGENVTVTTGNNGLSAGPITISSGFSVTVETGAIWVIV